jgi:membrane protease subunit HflK
MSSLRNQIESNWPPNVSWNSGWVVLGLAAVFVLVVLTSMFYQIPADSVGVVLRFGKKVRKVGPGLHTKWPLGIEEVRTVPVQRQQKVEFGYRTAKAGVNTQYREKGYDRESLMLTGDLNVVDVEWAVQYRISDPEKYLFEVRDVRETFRYMSQAVMREVVGDRTVNEVLTMGRTEVASRFKEKLQKLCNDYQIGLRVEQINLQDITPPDPVKPSFNAVNEAQQKRAELINQAKADYNKAIPAARGEAKREIQKAEGYAIDRTNRAQGEVARFESLYREYKKAPDVTRRRIYIETLGEVLPKVRHKWIIDEKATDVVPLMPLGEGQNLQKLSGSKGTSN